MNAGAWVRLEGYRRGAGRTILGIGYDLLAGLSESEVEAVLAHEMAHSKLVQRGLKTWLNKGLHRSAILTGQLSARAEAFRRAERSSSVGEGFLRVSDILTSYAARLVSAYSRQDEFEADRGAVDLCGSAPLRSSLLRLEAMTEKLARMPWRERVGQLELEGSFHGWLARELEVTFDENALLGGKHVRDPYSTHPALRDRLAVLPPDDRRPRSDASGLELLTNPDHVARDLMEEIQRVVAIAEQKDTKTLARWARKTQRTANLRSQQIPGILMVLFGIFVGVVAFAGDSIWQPLLVVIGIVTAGVLAYRAGRYRDKRKFPVPSYAAIKATSSVERPKNLTEQEKSIEAEMLKIGAGEKKRRKFILLLDEANASLARCDYLRAHLAARLAQKINAKSVDVALALGVAAGGLRLIDQVQAMFRFIQKQTGLGTLGTTWGAAWTLVLIEDWNGAEALLWRLHEKQPDEPTFLCLLAMAQSVRGKLQGAIKHAQRAVELAPQEMENAKLLARLLLDAGRLREAGARLVPLSEFATSDGEIALMKVRWHLARREFDLAVQWVDTLRQINPRADWLLRVGEWFEAARQDEKATTFFESALNDGFYPEAHVGLARLARNRRDKPEARQHLTAALNFEKTVGTRGRGPGPLFQNIVNELMLLEEPRERCCAWIVTVPRHYGLPAIAGHSFMVFGEDQRAAEQHFGALLGALQPGSPPAMGTLTWRAAPKDRQPDRPVRPGVQFAF
jgi:tetratricopeptide (TPR) repeat protein